MPTRSSKPQRSWSHKLGPSLKAVFDYMKKLGRPVTSIEVGYDLYDQVCSTANSTKWETPKNHRATQWASHLLSRLERRGYVVQNKKEGTWSVDDRQWTLSNKKHGGNDG